MVGGEKVFDIKQRAVPLEYCPQKFRQALNADTEEQSLTAALSAFSAAMVTYAYAKSTKPEQHRTSVQLNGASAGPTQDVGGAWLGTNAGVPVMNLAVKSDN